MKAALIDSHCHLDDDRFDTDREQVLQRAAAVGIRQLVMPATTQARWGKVADVAAQNDGVYAAYGLHPMFMAEHRVQHIDALDEWLDRYPSVAVGECGLDFYRSNDDEAVQLELFRAQLNVAANHDKPVIIHARKALDLVIRELRQSTVCSGVIHSFSGSQQQAEQLVGLGFKLGIAATISFDRAKKLRQVVKRIDASALLIESDAPDQPGVLHRGERNEPAFVADHLAVMAELRQLAVDDMALLVSSNCRSLFDLD